MDPQQKKVLDQSSFYCIDIIQQYSANYVNTLNKIAALIDLKYFCGGEGGIQILIVQAIHIYDTRVMSKTVISSGTYGITIQLLLSYRVLLYVISEVEKSNKVIIKEKRLQRKKVLCEAGGYNSEKNQSSL